MLKYRNTESIFESLFDSVLIDIDFAENLTVPVKYEPQSLHWCHEQVTVHSGIMKVKGEKTYHPYFSDSLRLDQVFVKKVLEEMLSDIEIPQESTIVIESDNCTSQYKSVQHFHNLQEISTKYNSVKASPRICLSDDCSSDYGSCSSFKEYPLICHQLKCVFLRSAVEAVDSLEDEQDDNEISSSDIIKNSIELDSIVAIAASHFSFDTILFPETRAIARAGIHPSKFTCAIYHMCEIIVFSLRRNFSLSIIYT